MRFSKILVFLVITVFSVNLFAKTSADKHLYPMKEKSQWGYIDKSGNWVIEPQYLNATPFYEGYAAVATKDREWKIIDKDGKQAIKSTFKSRMYRQTEWDTRYPSGGYKLFHEGLLPVYKSGKFQYINPDEEVVCEIECDEAYEFSDGLAKIEKDDKFGYINKKGEIVVKPQFEKARSFHEGRAAVMVRNKDKERMWGFIDKKGKMVIENKYREVGDFHEGLAIFHTESKRRKSGIYSLIGFLDKNGKVVIKPRFKPFNSLEHFSEGRFGAEIGNGNGYVNKMGQLITGTNLSDLTDFSEGLAFVKIEEENSDDRPVFIDKMGNVEIENEELNNSSFVWGFRNGLAKIAWNLDGSTGYSSSGSGRMRKVYNSYMGYMNKKGEIVAKQSQDEIDWINAKIDSAKRVEELAKKRKEERKRKEEKERLADCPKKLVYGDKSDNWLEFNYRGLNRKIYFDNVAVEKYRKGKYKIFYPPFGMSPEKRKMYLEDMKGGLFSGLVKSMLDKMARYIIQIDMMDTFDKVKFMSHDVLLFDCIKRVRKQHYKEVFEDFGSKQKVNFREMNNGNAVEITFTSMKSEDTANFVRGHINTSQVFDKTTEIENELTPAAKTKVAMEDKVNKLKINYYPDKNIIEYSDRGMFRRTSKLKVPEGGKGLIPEDETDDFTRVFDYEIFNDDEVLIAEYYVDLRKEQEDWNNSILLSPKYGKPDDLSDLTLDTSNLKGYIYSRDINKFDLNPMMIEPHESLKLPDKEPEPELKEVSITDLPSKAKPKYEDIEEFTYLADLNYEQYAAYLSEGEYKGDDCYILEIDKLESDIAKMEVNYKMLTSTLSDKQLDVLKEFVKKAINNEDYLEEHNDNKQAIKDIKKLYKILDLALPKDPSDKELKQNFMSAMSEKFGEKKLESLASKVMYEEAQKHDLIPLVETVYQVRQEVYSDKNGAPDEELKKTLKTALDEYGLELLNDELSVKSIRNIKTQMKEKYGRPAVRGAFAIFEDQQKEKQNPKIYIDEDTGLPIYSEFNAISKYRKYPATGLEIHYNSGSITVKAKNKKQGKDQLDIDTPKGIIDMYQFEPFIQFLPVDEDYSDELVLFGLKPFRRYSFSTDEGRDNLTKVKPVFSKVQLDVIGKTKLVWNDEEIDAYKLKAVFEGDVEAMPSIRSYERDLIMDKETGLGSVIYYVKSDFPHELVKVEYKDKDIEAVYNNLEE